ncbi:hypothetical protein [Microbulbifer epialgicus]|uniref:Uncharacterized protein n=1 Tax=Microbulbifer epialgicus TaxID=393907 RepID=A0ABV4NUA2_9GAMM
MGALKSWMTLFKSNNPLEYKFLMVLYFAFPLVLLVLGLMDNLPYFSTDSLSIFGAILIGLALVLITHISLAGIFSSFSQGNSGKGVSVACFGGVLLLFIISRLP